jgi:hypothetical protein
MHRGIDGKEWPEEWPEEWPVPVVTAREQRS